MKKIEVKLDPSYPHFGLICDGKDNPYHKSYDGRSGHMRVRVVNLDTGELCDKKLMENKSGSYFTHKGYSPVYLHELIELAWFIPYQTLAHGDLVD